ncbi:uncharacterized protein LOC112494657 [Cephus cinctus]|uniref:Uncharacterized protein LOC112494657 n=1 Tax=Cephus cinctus TaxID=211228 RepID=A0AAJ7RM24_CEPCN|nr:uncharacterized protein LOC112494657 [Cephus cinctus]
MFLLRDSLTLLNLTNGPTVKFRNAVPYTRACPPTLLLRTKCAEQLSELIRKGVAAQRHVRLFMPFMILRKEDHLLNDIKRAAVTCKSCERAYAILAFCRGIDHH